MLRIVFLIPLLCLIVSCTLVKEVVFLSDDSQLDSLTHPYESNERYPNKKIHFDFGRAYNKVWSSSDIPNGNLEFTGKLEKTARFNLGEGMDSELGVLDSFLVRGDILYYLDYDKTLYKFDVNNIKKPVWKTSLLNDNDDVGIFIGGALAFANDRLYITNGSFQIFAVNAASGGKIWSKEFKTPFRTAPAIGNELIVITDIHNKSYGLDKIDGSIKWIHNGINEQTVSIGGASPAVVDNIAIIPHSSGEIYGVNIQNGETLWSKTLVYNNNKSYTLSDIDQPLVVSNQVVYAASNSGTLSAIEVVSGQRLWSYNYEGIENFWLADNYIFIRTHLNTLICLDRATGAVYWKKPFDVLLGDEEQITGPTLVNDKLLFISNKGRIISLSYNGIISRVFKLKISEVLYRPVIASGKLFLFSNKGQILISQ